MGGRKNCSIIPLNGENGFKGKIESVYQPSEKEDSNSKGP